MCLERVRKSVQLMLVLAGILISAYAYHVEISKEHNSEYAALCDINEKISCSKVFTTKWGKGLGLLEHIVGRDSPLNQPNSLFGIVFYVLIFILETAGNSPSFVLAEVVLSTLSALSCVWLGYILFYVLEDVCVVCITMYAINLSILVCSINRYQHMKAKLARKIK